MKRHPAGGLSDSPASATGVRPPIVEDLLGTCSIDTGKGDGAWATVMLTVPLVATAIAQTLAARLAIARNRLALLTMSTLLVYDIDMDCLINVPSRRRQTRAERR